MPSMITQFIPSFLSPRSNAYFFPVARLFYFSVVTHTGKKRLQKEIPRDFFLYSIGCLFFKMGTKRLNGVEESSYDSN